MVLVVTSPQSSSLLPSLLSAPRRSALSPCALPSPARAALERASRSVSTPFAPKEAVAPEEAVVESPPGPRFLATWKFGVVGLTTNALPLPRALIWAVCTWLLG